MFKHTRKRYFKGSSLTAHKHNRSTVRSLNGIKRGGNLSYGEIFTKYIMPGIGLVAKSLVAKLLPKAIHGIARKAGLKREDLGDIPDVVSSGAADVVQRSVQYALDHGLSIGKHIGKGTSQTRKKGDARAKRGAGMQLY